MHNLYSKQQLTPQHYSNENVAQVIEAPCINKEGKCNFCDGIIYWNKSVRHRGTGKQLPLDKPFNGHNTNPVPHRGCKYNTNNFYKSLVILEKDSPYIKNKKLVEQARLMGYDYMARQTRYPMNPQWFSYSFNPK